MLLRVETSNRVTTAAADYSNMRVLITPCPGDTVLVPVSVSAANAVSSFLVKLKYDTVALDYIDYITIAPEVATANITHNYSQGRIDVNFVSPTTTNIADGELIALRFVAHSTADLVWDTTGFYLDSLGFGIPTRWVNGSVQVKTTAITNLSHRMCAGELYQMGGVTYTQTGVYTSRLQGVNSCDSIVNLTLTVGQPDTVRLNRTLCRGGSVMVGGFPVTSAGNYSFRLTNQFGCDSVVMLNLQLRPTNLDTVDAIICPNGYYVVGAQTFNQSGTYTVTMMNEFGCDSVVVLNLQMRQQIVTNLQVSLCAGSTYTVGNRDFTTSGNYSVVLNTRFGCDSVVNLSLTIPQRDTTILTRNICLGDAVMVGNQSFSTPGTYHVLLQNAASCDSVVQLVLGLNPRDTVNLSTSICQGSYYQVGTQIFNSSGAYQVLLMNRFGCDSLVNLALTVNPTDTMRINQRLCAGQTFTVGTQTFSASGNYQLTLQNQAGCDSVIILSLVFDNAIRVRIDTSICAGQQYRLPRGIWVNAAGIYEDTLVAAAGCDSIITTVLQIKPKPNTGLPTYLQACTGSAVRVTVPNGTLVTWNGPNGFTANGAEMKVPDLGDAGTATFTVSITLPDACTYIDTVEIDIRLCELVIPQGISPNADGFNDKFFIRGLENYPNAGIQIFNRGGSLVYEATPYPNDFDGAANRNIRGELGQGTYFYMLDLGDGKRRITGYVYISR